MSFFDAAYKEGTPPWDIGRPQPAFEALEQDGEIAGSVLDVGCGTGENSLYLASRGHDVWGIDFAETAVERARAKAVERGLNANFVVGNALDLRQLRRKFDTAIDCGLFHVFSDEERIVYAASLAAVLNDLGRYFMLCFSEHQPGTEGPRRVTQVEIRSTFAIGWRIEYIRPAEFGTNLGREPVKAWLSSIRWVG